MDNTKKNTVNKKLRFGVFSDGPYLQNWQKNAVDLLLNNGVDLCLIIVNDNENKKKTFLNKISKYFNKNGFYNFYDRFLLKPKARNFVEDNSFFDTTDKIYCKTNNKGFSQYFSENDIEKIKLYKLDFILRFGFNIIRGEILKSAKYGVWSFHHDDEKKYRGGPAGFWEIFNNDKVNGAILQRLTDKLDAGIILRKAYFKTVLHCYSANIDQMYFESAKWPLQICRDINNNITDYLQKSPTNNKFKIFRKPENFKFIIFLFRIFFNKIKFHYKELFKAEDWNVAVAEQNIEEFVFGNRKTPEWLHKHKKGIYFADPFAYADDNGNLKILFEDYNYKNRKGVISQFDYKSKQKILAIECPSHLSFPFIVEHKGEIYSMPEASQSNRLDIYKLDKASNKFSFAKTLIKNMQVVDPALFEYNNYWWLFFTVKEFSNSMLYIYYSEDFLGDYQPHKNNPVKIDICSSRPAGNLFYHNNELYRPAQNCSETYGGKLAINKINKLTPFEFSETTVKFLEPFKNQIYNKAFHTISSCGNYTIIDGKRFVFDFNNFLYHLKKKIFKK